MRSPHDYDVAVIGGGAAGTAAALALSRYTGLRVALIEKRMFDDYRAGESVSASLFSLLDYLGIGRHALAGAQLPTHSHAAAWGSDALVVRDAIFSAQGHGLQLDRQRYDAIMLEQAAAAGADLLRPARIAHIEHGDPWRLQLLVGQGDMTISARYLIDCSGKSAALVRHRARPVHTEDTLVALYAYYELSAPTFLPQQTLVETTEHGWYYVSPLPDDKVAVAFITDADILKRLHLNEAQNWRDMGLTTAHASGIMARLPAPAAMRHYAIHSRVAALPDDENWCAAGDAAACFDPISSLGIGQAVSSGIQAARVAEAFLIGDRSLARHYNRSVFDGFEAYLHMRRGFYAAEARWRDAPFWRRRSAQNVAGNRSRA
ncbi:MAG: FAD-dependent oxidoreductase [Pseudomonadota bacterium]